jgi:hypothetical protein
MQKRLRAWGFAFRADHICIARNSFCNFPSIGEKSFHRIRQCRRICSKGESNMINKLLGAAAMAAVAYAVVPASAAKMAGCSGENLSKTESMIDAMADGEGKITAQKEVALAQTAMLDGKIGVCSAHLTKAMHVGTSK